MHTLVDYVLLYLKVNRTAEINTVIAIHVPTSVG
jgi:hypothetical protein